MRLHGRLPKVRISANAMRRKMLSCGEPEGGGEGEDAFPTEVVMDEAGPRVGKDVDGIQD